MRKLGLNIIILCFFMGIFILPSCKKCREPLKSYGFLPEMTKYFGMFKNDNWWVYVNQDGTKQDSIYITDYTEIIRKDQIENCLT